MDGKHLDGLRLIIAAAPRSGTEYISALLRSCGVRCGHESVYGLHVNLPGSWVADASWLSIPRLPRRPSSAKIAHQLRDPRRAIASQVVSEAWCEWPVNLYAQFICEHFNVEHIADPALRAAMLWLQCTEQIRDMQPATWYRVEDVGPGEIEELAELAGADAQHVLDSLREIPRTLNHRRPPQPLGWDDLPRCVEQLAKDYGYT